MGLGLANGGRFMLDLQRLKILPWMRTAGRLETGAVLPDRRLLLEANTNSAVGFVCSSAYAGPRWLRWLTRQGQWWEVHEREDESLLFSLREYRGVLPGSCWSSWNVMDADNLLFGTLECRKHRTSLGRGASALARDMAGQQVAALERWPEYAGVPVRILQPGAPPALTELATVCTYPDHILIEFSPSLQEDPFGKMLVLATVLAASY